MKHLYKAVCLFVLLTLLSGAALADSLYLIPDSNTRRLSEEEIWKWDRESIGFIFNEIFARHGYVFNSGGKYDLWFSAMPWYEPNASSDNQRYCYPKLSQLEWDNYHTIKRVAAEMDKQGYKGHDSRKKCYRNITPPQNDFTLSGFSYLNLKSNQKLPVYSAPGTSSWRGANNKASVSTNGGVWSAGWEDGWLLIYYETNNHAIRVGYVDGRAIKGRVDEDAYLIFEDAEVTITENCRMTDDPMKANTLITSLHPGTRVTYLSSFVNQYGQLWGYIETVVDGKRARGFVPDECLDHPTDPLFDAK